MNPRIVKDAVAGVLLVAAVLVGRSYGLPPIAAGLMLALVAMSMLVREDA
jgi:hypothetical protein